MKTKTRGKEYFTQLASGALYFPNRPEDLTVDVNDIVTSLTQQVRYLGHFGSYTVAQHSIHMMQLAPPELKLEALLHDATEAYLGDVPYPIKKMLPDFVRLENALWAKAIAPHFDLNPTISDEVKSIDRAIVASEYYSFAPDAVFESGVRWEFHCQDIEPLTLPQYGPMMVNMRFATILETLLDVHRHVVHKSNYAYGTPEYNSEFTHLFDSVITVDDRTRRLYTEIS